MKHSLRCHCGTIKGTVNDPRRGNRVICYCRDCQAFAHFLGKANEVLDAQGGSEVIQVLPKNVTFTQGIEALACMRLSPKGLLRWYAGCCRTPIGNTLDTPTLSFVGLVSTCLEQPRDAFGPVGSWVFTNSARGDPKPRQAGLGKSVWWFVSNALKARISGDYKHTPFFLQGTATPIVTPRVLSKDERERLVP